MKRFAVCMLAALCLLLGGCGWMEGSYSSVKPHREQSNTVQDGMISVSNYRQLREAMEALVEAGYEKASFRAGKYDQNQLPLNMESAIRYIRGVYPLGVYAVDDITYDIGTIGGEPAISVTISYIHGRSEIRCIQDAADMEAVKLTVSDVLNQCSEEIVLRVKDYAEADLIQFVRDYARENPDIVMEVPRVAVGVYPDTGKERIVELEFVYQTGRDSLRQMQTQVQDIFESMHSNVDQTAQDSRKYYQLYTILMERWIYRQETSITPAYSLLCHGVGDSQSFATVYAALCRQAGLECWIVSGTKAGNPWFWNLLKDEEGYAYLDLLQSSQNGRYTRMTRGDMQGYVWDYSAFPDSAD